MTDPSYEEQVALRWFRKYGNGRQMPEPVLYHLVSGQFITGRKNEAGWELTQRGRQALENMPWCRADEIL